DRAGRASQHDDRCHDGAEPGDSHCAKVDGGSMPMCARFGVRDVAGYGKGAGHHRPEKAKRGKEARDDKPDPCEAPPSVWLKMDQILWLRIEMRRPLSPVSARTNI